MEWMTLVGIMTPVALFAIGVALRFAVDAKQAAARVELGLADFRTEVAKDYATGRALDKVQESIMHELEKLNKKLDRLVEQRMEGR